MTGPEGEGAPPAEHEGVLLLGDGLHATTTFGSKLAELDASAGFDDSLRGSNQRIAGT